ncbi:MAG: dITP/XTP pyrophosphatase [Chlamydiia bacterium]|nr:dITP/XTP pyrophosphatase [Chlamydiia bacterium]
MNKLLIASHNLHKILEIKSMLKGRFELDIYSLRDFPEYRAPEEGVESFEENAVAKAVNAARALGMFAIADDSGLIVPALGNRPGVTSARYAGEGATDKDNINKLIGEIEPLSVESRSAYFECRFALASPDKLLKTAKGLCEGSLITTPRGGMGFGYDPIFIKYDYSKTLAELDEDTKNRISHRRKAFDKMIPHLEELFLPHVKSAPFKLPTSN